MVTISSSSRFKPETGCWHYSNNVWSWISIARRATIHKNLAQNGPPTTIALWHYPPLTGCCIEKVRIANPGGQLKLFSTKSQEALLVESFVKNLSNAQIHTVGPDLIFGTLFDRIGFNAINSDLFRHITIARLAYPTSKLKTVDYLKRYKPMSTPRKYSKPFRLSSMTWPRFILRQKTKMTCAK